MSPLKRILPEGEAWTERWWGVIQASILGLVAYLSLQAVGTQTSLAQMVTEHRYTNARLEKIEGQLERASNFYATKEDALREQVRIEKACAVLENRLESHSMALEDLRNRVGRR